MWIEKKIIFRFVFCFFSIQPASQGCTVEFGTGKHVCGNGVAEGDELCDGKDMRGETCESLGLGEGTLACLESCKGFDVSGCTAKSRCGNNLKEEGEICDGTDLGGIGCEHLGFEYGVLACLDDCSGFDASGCTGEGPVCGNDIREEPEVCDGGDMGSETCESLGFYGGDLACLADCSDFDTSECFGLCGDGVINGNEVCDGAALGGETCESLGFYGGDLACLSDCSGFDTSSCSPCPDGWAYIPAGDFEMGCNPSELCWGGYENESPRHTVTLSAYCIQMTQVTVSAYRECRTAESCTGHVVDGGGQNFYNWTMFTGSREGHPINDVDWNQARQYCQWAGGDLPTEAQWEKAARGTDQRTYPWGDSPEPSCDLCNWNYSGSGFPIGCNDAGFGPGTWSAGYLSSSEGDSPYGLKDMAGNVWEWTLDCYDPSFYESCPDDCTDPLRTLAGCPTNRRVLRGGSFETHLTSHLRVSMRERKGPSHSEYDIGFRCVMAPVE